MRTLYLDCSMGAAGDMLAAALLELIPDSDEFIDVLNSLGISGVEFKKEKTVKRSVSGTQLIVTINGSREKEGHFNHKNHNKISDIKQIVSSLPLSARVRGDIIAVYNLIAEAESRVHNAPVSEIHFHEVGNMDAIADITAVCMLMERLSPDLIAASNVNVGSGHVKCEHGILPVPAPATALILKDVPIYSNHINGELCTPTGAALLKRFVKEFGAMPLMKVEKIGYGMGSRDFEAVNCVRAMLGNKENASDTICELLCNIDDMSGEDIGYAMEKFYRAGALDVYYIPIGMKKNRPGVLIGIMCRESEKECLIHTIFKHTTTIGIRENLLNRYILERHTESVRTAFGNVRRKISSGYGIKRVKYEHEDIARNADENNISIDEARAEADRSVADESDPLG